MKAIPKIIAGARNNNLYYSLGDNGDWGVKIHCWNPFQWGVKSSKTTRRILLDLQLTFNLQMAMNRYRVWFQIIKCLSQWVKTRGMSKTKFGINDPVSHQWRNRRAEENIEKRNAHFGGPWTQICWEKNTPKKVLYENVQTHMSHKFNFS